MTAISIIIIVVFLFVFFVNDIFGGLTTSSRKIDTTLSDKVEMLKITIDDNAIYPYSMYLKMSGKINGKGILHFGWNDTVFYKSFNISNEFLIDYNNGDWYSDSCIIKYEPITATKGELKIDCAIHSSRKSKF